MGEISLAASATLLVRTWRFLVLRAVIYLGIAAAFVVAAVGGGGIGSGLGTFLGMTGHAAGTFWGTVAGLAFVVLLLHWLREYLLYLVEAGHAAALALAADSKRAGIGEAMTALQRRFPEAEALLAAERLVRGTLHAVAGATDATTRFLSGVALPQNVFDVALRLALGVLVKSFFALVLRRKARNVYGDVQTSLVLLAQNGETLLHGALLIAAASLGITLAAFFIVLIPVLALMQPANAGAWLVAPALSAILAWSLRQALLEPLATAALVELGIRKTAGQDPDPDWDARLAEISPAYLAIKALAPPPRTSRRGIVV